jgi:hypothetical protein
MGQPVSGMLVQLHMSSLQWVEGARAAGPRPQRFPKLRGDRSRRAHTSVRLGCGSERVLANAQLGKALAEGLPRLRRLVRCAFATNEVRRRLHRDALVDLDDENRLDPAPVRNAGSAARGTCPSGGTSPVSG